MDNSQSTVDPETFGLPREPQAAVQHLLPSRSTSLHRNRAYSPPERRISKNWSKVRDLVLSGETPQRMQSLESQTHSRNHPYPEPSLSKSNETRSTTAIPSSNSTSTLEQVFTSPSKGALTNLLRFKAAVQQRTDVYKMEREIERLFQTSSQSGGAGSVTFGVVTNPTMGLGSSSMSGSLGGAIAAAKVVKNVHQRFGSSGEIISTEQSHSSHMEIKGLFADLLEILKRWKPVGLRLPMVTEILAELARPFLAYPPNVEDCEQALDVFDYIRDNYTPADVNENYLQILWLTRQLQTKNTRIKLRVCALLNVNLVPDIGTRALPQTVLAVHTLTYSFVYTLANLQGQSEEVMNLQYTLHRFLDQLCAGDFICVSEDEYAPLKDADVPKEVRARCIFLEGLMKCLSVRDPRVRRYVVMMLLKNYWGDYDFGGVEGSRKALEHIVFLFADAAAEILTEHDAAREDSAAGQTSISYVLMNHLETNLNPSSLNIRSRAVVQVLVTATLAALGIPTRQDQNPTLMPRLTPRESDDGNDWDDRRETKGKERLGLDNDSVSFTAKKYLVGLWDKGWKLEVILLVKELFQEDNFDRIIRIYSQLVFGVGEEIGLEVAQETLLLFLDKLTSVSPPPSPHLTTLLLNLARHHPTIFYKPILNCVASDSVEKVTQHLILITTLEKYISGVQLWMRDADMMSVIALSDIGKKGTSTESSNGPVWGKTSLGQCVIVLEFIWTVKELRRKRRTANMEDIEVAKKFLFDLEKRIAIFMAAKEKTHLVPMPLRVLLCNLFLEIRLFCSYVHRPGWMSRMIDWLLTSFSPTTFYHEYNENDSTKSVAQTHLNDIIIMFQKIRIVYAEVDELNAGEEVEDENLVDRPVSVVQPQGINKRTVAEGGLPLLTGGGAKGGRRRISALLPPRVVKPKEKEKAPSTKSANEPPPLESTTTTTRRLGRISDINQDPYGSILSLLVAVYVTINNEELALIAPHIWDCFMDDRRRKAFHAALFLLMLCGERSPNTIVGILKKDFENNDHIVRTALLRKISSFFGHRHNIVTQEFISDTSQRRPFRTPALVLPFIPTELGSNKFTLDEPRWMAKLRSVGKLTIEMRKQIQELGWEEEELEEDKHDTLRRELTPLYVLPTFYLEDGDENPDEAIDPSRRRRRGPVVIPTLSIASLEMISLIGDGHSTIFNSLREVIAYFLRDDPPLFLRVFLGDLGRGSFERQKTLLTKLRFLLTMQLRFPPDFTSSLFNHLTGLMKWYTRDNKEGGLALMAVVHPLLTELVFSTNELSIRDLRKNKLEYLLCNTGQFWFSEGQPASMFPRGPEETTTGGLSVLDIPKVTFQVGMLRISHLQFLINYLERYPREVYAVKKTFQEYEETPLGRSESHDKRNEEVFFPDMKIRETLKNSSNPLVVNKRQEDMLVLSSLRARVWLKFLDTMLHGLNKNYNDRGELERILRGVNDTLLNHPCDLELIGAVLILYSRLAMRFHRLFGTNRGYNLILPVLFRLFCELEYLPAVRAGVIFLWYRFFQLHQESFVFQMLGCLVPLILKAFAKSPELGKSMSSNLFQLIEVLNDPPPPGSMSDVLGTQLQADYDARRVKVEAVDAEHEQHPLVNPLANTFLKPLILSNTPEPVSGFLNLPIGQKTFPLEDSVKLFLTVIAYDPGSLRAEQFVKMLRYLIPYFINESSSVQSLVDEGIPALIEVFFRFVKTTKPTLSNSSNNNQPTATVPTDGVIASEPFQEENEAENTENNGGFFSSFKLKMDSTQQAYGKQWYQNDRLAIKLDFLLLVQEYFKRKGTISDGYHDRMAQMIRAMLKDLLGIRKVVKTDWIKDYITDICLSIGDISIAQPAIMSIIKEVYTPFRSQYKTVDLASIIDGFATLVEQSNGRLAVAKGLPSALCDKVIAPALTNMMRPDWDEDGPRQLRFCDSLVRLIVALMEHSTENVIAEIDKIPPSPIFMAYVIVPICLQYNLRSEYAVKTLGNSSNSQIATKNWLQLLAYVTRACNKNSLLKVKSPGFSIPTNNSNNNTGMNPSSLSADHHQSFHMNIKPQDSSAVISASFIINFIAFKIILIRSGRAMTSSKGLWMNTAIFAKTSLEMFLNLSIFRTAGFGASPINSPGGGGGTSPTLLTPKQEDGGSPFAETVNLFDQRPLNLKPSHWSTTANEFTLWSFLEFAVFYKTPMMIYLRTFVHQKIHELGRNHRFSLAEAPRRTSSLNLQSPGTPKWPGWGGGGVGGNNNSGNGSSSGSGNHPIHHGGSSGADGATVPDPFRLRQVSSDRTYPPPPPTPSSLGTGFPFFAGDEDAEIPAAISRRASFAPSAIRDSMRTSKSLFQQTAQAVSNVQIFMGYRSLSHDPAKILRPWPYQYTVDQLVEEWKLVMESCPEIFSIVDRGI